MRLCIRKAPCSEKGALCCEVECGLELVSSRPSPCLTLLIDESCGPTLVPSYCFSPDKDILGVTLIWWKKRKRFAALSAISLDGQLHPDRPRMCGPVAKVVNCHGAFIIG